MDGRHAHVKREQALDGKKLNRRHERIAADGGSVTIPPSPTSAAGASNWGFTSVQNEPEGFRHASTASIIFAMLVNETSHTARSMAPA